MDFELDNMQEIVDEFIIETDDIIVSLDTNFVELESQPDNIELLNEIFRGAHTIKGTSSFLGLNQITSLTHKMEDILNKLRKVEIVASPEIMDVLLEALDLLKVLLQNLKEGTSSEDLDLTEIIQKLESFNVKTPEPDSGQDHEISKREQDISSDEGAKESEEPDESAAFDMGDMQEIIEDFLVESDDLIASLDANLVTLEGEPENLDLLNEIFRAAHTIKGTSSFLGLDQVTSLTHKMEDILNRLRKSELRVTPGIMDVLLESLDILRILLDNVRKNNAEPYDLEQILSRLTATDGGMTETSVQVSTINDKETKVAAPAPVVPSEQSPVSDSSQATHKKTADQTIRVDVERLDTLMNMMGELVLGRNSMVQTVGNLMSEYEGDYNLESLGQATNSINFITTELQMAVMKMRMQPIGKVFKKFPRLVRDLSRDSKKDIVLEMNGESTELDKSVIEEIGDPLVHIIRNSCDHGIESPEDRVAQGKPRQGKIKLSAMQEGSNILIKIEDDGKGLDVDAIRRKALERNLISKAELDNLPDKDVFRFIFNAGFSTAKKITDISGRGVGMDVVRTNIEKLNGLIELESELGTGTTISIKLPLTLAIIQGLLVQSDKEIFILPLSSVYETVKTDQSEIFYVNKRPVLRLREDVIPIINLHEILKSSSSGFVLTEKPYIVIVGLAEKKLGIIIDRFMGQEEVVIKSLGQYLGTTEGIAGATILGDGRVRLIVDLIGLFNIAKRLS